MVDSFNIADDPELAGTIKIRDSDAKIADHEKNQGFKPEFSSQQVNDNQASQEPTNTLDEPVSETIVSLAQL
jgi:hypothetical protein